MNLFQVLVVADEMAELIKELEADDGPLLPPLHTSSPIGVSAMSELTVSTESIQRLSPLNKVMLSS